MGIGLLSSIVVTPVALATDNDSSNIQFRQTKSLSSKEHPKYQLDITEGKDGSFTVTVKGDSTKIKDANLPRCYPAITCYNPPKDTIDLPIGQSKTVIDYVKRADIPKYYDNAGGNFAVNLIVSAVVGHFTGEIPGILVSALMEAASKAVQAKNDRMKSWANDPSIQGMKITTTIAHMYNGYLTSVTYAPWK